jgi:CRISPR-associated protein Cas2
MNMIVAYDIAEPRRLNKVAEVIKDYGIRVQKSIFEVDVSDKSFIEMKARIEDIINPSEDGVKYVPLCEKCAASVEIIGQGVFTDLEEDYFVL